MKKSIFALVITLFFHPLVGQNLLLPSIFSDNMILQRQIENPVWGKATPKSTVVVQIGNCIISVKSSASGDWHVKLPVLDSNLEYELTVWNLNQKVEFRHVILGDVYYVGGQSNMQFALKKSTGGIEALKRADYPNIRLFKVPQSISYKPQFDLNRNSTNGKCAGHWCRCDSLSAVNFSAIGFYFTEILHREEKIPIGIIDVSWGGTPIEAHSSLEVNNHFSDFKKDVKTIRSKSIFDTLTIEKSKSTPQLPSSIYNAMIHPLIPYGIKAFVWYQGEHNWNYPQRYEAQLKAMIKGVRKSWRMPTMPLFIVQLPNIGKKDSLLTDYYWAVLRESQAKVAAMPHNHLCVTIDLGEDGNLHPKNKLGVAKRLAELAQNHLYNHPKSGLSPAFKSFRVIGNQIELTFTDVTEGFQSVDSIVGFAICGADNKFVWANASISGNKIVVSHPEISKPKAVRYAWGNNPTCNLFNAQGFPIAPFRTDRFQLPKDGKW
ncbi:MAG: sialate O-acetylesterase [Bacteroidales bacterium]|nr:sialate O-acetylesterase [Bacteroidales bacterium]